MTVRLARLDRITGENMSNFDVISKALWELERDWHKVEQAKYSCLTEARLLPDPRICMFRLSPYTDKVERSICGIPVQIDPLLPEGEIRLESSTGQVLRTVNIGLTFGD